MTTPRSTRLLAVGALAIVIAAALGFGGGAWWSSRNSDASPTVSIRPLGEPVLITRTGPWRDAPMNGVFTFGDELEVDCKAEGEVIAASNLNTNLWYRFPGGEFVTGAYAVPLADVPWCDDRNPAKPTGIPDQVKAMVNAPETGEVTVHQSPDPASKVTARLTNLDLIDIVCYRRGTSIEGVYGPNNLWNKMKGGDFVPDGFLLTGTSDPVVRRC